VNLAAEQDAGGSLRWPAPQGLGWLLARWLWEPALGPVRLVGIRWLFLRALGLIYFSAFFSLHDQICGLIGPRGVLPARVYLEEVWHVLGWRGLWFAPTVLWVNSSDFALRALCWLGMAAAVLLVLNLWSRAMLALCFVLFLSFVTAAEDFSSYQSDGMLLAASLFALLLAPKGRRPGWALEQPPRRVAVWLLRWEWFRIYFESGVAKLVGHDPQWRHLTAMDHYYENGPLPTWLAWYAAQLPHCVHAATALFTLVLELGLVWMVFLPRPFRLALFLLTSFFQIGILLTANYAFLNYLTLAEGLWLLDDRLLARLGLLPRRLAAARPEMSWVDLREAQGPAFLQLQPQSTPPSFPGMRQGRWRERLRAVLGPVAGLTFCLWMFYATGAKLLAEISPALALPAAPVVWLEPFRVANLYGLFGVMTRARYEIEFQGSRDGHTWVAYPFRYKPQDPARPPGFFAPYQPRLDWNLWFASLGPWTESPFVLRIEQCLLDGEPTVLELFAGDPFGGEPPAEVRAVLWQYWFADPQAHRRGLWWQRRWLGLYAPALARRPDGRYEIIAMPTPILTWP
jgi:hypothetical protein